MNKPENSRRAFVKKAVYVAPAIADPRRHAGLR